ncbi:MAG: hypothetical protein J6Y78_07590 [Paludibacteraceae bacterium]|jgi:hypothetical protein|nr:hypothetical protein [Paludibacteraceae bacterium]
MNWTDYTEAIRLSKAQWNQPVTSKEAVEQQKKLDKSVGIKNPYLGMSFKELKALGRGLR